MIYQLKIGKRSVLEILTKIHLISRLKTEPKILATIAYVMKLALVCVHSMPQVNYVWP